MALFDPTAILSAEVCAAHCLADAIAEDALFQELADVPTSEEARDKIIVGPAAKPNDGAQFTPDELAGRFIFVEINRVDGSHVVASHGIPGAIDPETDLPAARRQQGQLEIAFRRYAREGEDAQKLYLGYWDRISQMAVNLQTAIDNGECGPVQHIVEPQGPYRSSWKVGTAQGSYIWSTMVATWGDQLGGDQ